MPMGVERDKYKSSIGLLAETGSNSHSLTAKKEREHTKTETRSSSYRRETACQLPTSRGG